MEVARMITPLRWTDGVLELLEQRLLPAEESWIRCSSGREVAEAITAMVVRGAPAIGVSAAFGLALDLRRAAEEGRDLAEELPRAAERLKQARPTAVNLAWAVDRLAGVAERALADGLPAGEVAHRIEEEARAILEEDVQANRELGRAGSLLVPDGARILTHCNAGALATAGYGTALGVIRAAVEEGKKVEVFADETRPYLQGARLTAWELQKDEIPVTVITDNAAGHLMARGEIDMVITGADRIALNGDTANKIGTYTVAVLARRHGLPFYVAAPTSTIDPATADGSRIPIEERDAAEVLEYAGRRCAPEGVPARHPAFDVTPAELVTAIITEKGVARAPYAVSLRSMLGLEDPEEERQAQNAADFDENGDSQAPGGAAETEEASP
ncbi:MAG: S-methyl-5-thioribose-1-phosphate isomerase [Acidobacteriota bacterium]|nr:S-methyl-5-thioribose-1-phosphate isomerase [Acidobacteriota bacterium]MDQ7088490.1 S-methyl-5-thioribose-1-phosphate isomerase [Acidobacteriota bacterium]